MEAPRWSVIKDGYVIDIVLWDDTANPDWQYPHPHDYLVHDEHERVMKGDWYQEDEDLFYRPLGTPPDLPSELQS